MVTFRGEISLSHTNPFHMGVAKGFAAFRTILCFYIIAEYLYSHVKNASAKLRGKHQIYFSFCKTKRKISNIF